MSLFKMYGYCLPGVLLVFTIAYFVAGDSHDSRPLNSLINHAFSCDCFRNNNNFENRMHAKATVKVEEPEKPLYIIQGARNHFMNQYNRAKIDEFLSRQSTSFITQNGFMDWLNPQQVLTFPQPQPRNEYDENFILRDEPRDKKRDVQEENENISMPFSFSNGGITSKLKKMAEIISFVDQFGCRCAGNFSSIFKAKKFLRISIAHV